MWTNLNAKFDIPDLTNLLVTFCIKLEHFKISYTFQFYSPRQNVYWSNLKKSQIWSYASFLEARPDFKWNIYSSDSLVAVIMARGWSLASCNTSNVGGNLGILTLSRLSGNKHKLPVYKCSWFVYWFPEYRQNRLVNWIDLLNIDRTDTYIDDLILTLLLIYILLGLTNYIIICILCKIE